MVNLLNKELLINQQIELNKLKCDFVQGEDA